MYKDSIRVRTRNYENKKLTKSGRDYVTHEHSVFLVQVSISYFLVWFGFYRCEWTQRVKLGLAGDDWTTFNRIRIMSFLFGSPVRRLLLLLLPVLLPLLLFGFNADIV
jgi:hypothetical protein